MTFLNTLYYKISVYTAEVVISNQTELGAGGRVVEELFSDSVFKIFLHLILISSTCFA